MILTQLYKQGDPRWGQDHMGNSPQTIALGGCNVTCLAMGFFNYGIKETPGTLVEKMNAVDGFDETGYPRFTLIEDIFPTLTLLGQTQTEVNPIKSYRKVRIGEALEKLESLHALGQAVLVGVSLNDKTVQDHFVLLKKTVLDTEERLTDLIVLDPAFGDEILLSGRYGKPHEAVFSFLAYYGPPLEVPDFTPRRILERITRSVSSAAWKQSVVLKTIAPKDRPYPASTYLPEVFNGLIT